MIKRKVIFAAILAMGMTMSQAAAAEEAAAPEAETQAPEVVEEVPGETETSLGGLVGSLLGEGGVIDTLLGSEETREELNALFAGDGPLAGVLPEDVSVDQALDIVQEHLSDAGVALQSGIDGAVEMFTNEDGSVNWEKVEGEVEDLLAFIMSSGGTDTDTPQMDDEEDLDSFIEELLAPYKKADEAMFAYIGEMNAERMDTGDAQVFSKVVDYVGDLNQEEVRVMGIFTQVNYAVDGDQMKMVSAADDTMLFTLTRNEDGSFTVAAAEHALDGEEYAASVETMCGEAGISVDDFYSFEPFAVCNAADALAAYLRDHPEISSADFQGEQMNLEQLEAFSEAYIDSAFETDPALDDAEDAEGEVVEALTEAVTE